MKLVKYTVVAVFFFHFYFILDANILYAQSGWFWQNPLPQGNELNSIKFVNQNTGYMISRLGLLMKTTNSGTNWNIIMSDATCEFKELEVTSDGTVFVIVVKVPIDLSNYVIKSTNGGINWSWYYIGNGYRSYCSDFTNSMFGYFFTSTDFVTWQLYKTVNGGVNWSYLQSLNDIVDVEFLNETTGYAVGQWGYACKTSNGGNNWVVLNTSIGTGLNSICIIDSNKVVVVGDNRKIIVTSNGGLNWSVYSSSTQIPYLDLNAVDFFDSNTGFAAGGYGTIIKTTNGGVNWDSVSTPSSFDNFFAVRVVSNGVAFAVGQYGLICKSEGNWNNWILKTQRYIGGNFIDVHFINVNTGFIINDPWVVLKTTSGGQDWDTVHYVEGDVLCDIYFANPNTGFLVGKRLYTGKGIIMKSTNGGNNWNLQNYNSLGYLNTVYFLDSMNGFIGTDRGRLHKTTSRGLTWDSTFLNQQNIVDIKFMNQSTGFVVEEGYIYKTTNLGVNWNIVYTASHEMMSISIVDSTLYVPSGIQKLLRSTNAGANWSNVIVGEISDEIRKVQFVNANTGYIIELYHGCVLKTTNSCGSWFHQTRIPNATDFQFLNENTGYLVGEKSAVLKTTTGGVPLDFNPLSKNIPLVFYLHQNYPNPFNPKTKIEFELIRSSAVKIYIYDILGRKIAELINGVLGAGTYSVNWDASSYSSGIYFYRLETDGFSETRKMVLLK